MIKYIYAYKDKKLGCFPGFFLDNLPADKEGVAISRAISSVDKPEKLTPYQDLDLYYLGTFDDETGVIVSCLEFVLDLTNLVYPILANARKEELDNGKDA